MTEEGIEEENDDDDDDVEAFADDDDVTDEFKEAKKKIVNASALNDIDLTFPGWGQWGGTWKWPKDFKMDE